MTETMDRRRFLEHTAAGGAAAGLALAGDVSAAADTADRVTIGVMGLSRGSALARGFARLPGVQVKYLCDVDTTRLANTVKSFAIASGGSPQGVRDFRKILDDPEVDALVCAAPNHWHAPATVLACAAGKHVYVEKPCSHNPWEGELMVTAARKHDRAVQVGTQRRSGPGTRAAIERLRAGAIGRVYLARCWYASARGPLPKQEPAAVPAGFDYDLWQGPAARRPYVTGRIPYNWHWCWHWGNGELGNNGVHTLDLCRWGLDADYPVRVTSSGGRYCFDDQQETPDTQTVCLEFEDKRAIAWHGLSCNRHPRGFVTFYGEQGALDLDSNGDHRIFDKGDKLIKEEKGSSLGDREHLANFVAAIRTGKPLSVNADVEEGHKSALLCHLGNIAQRTGRALRCAANNGHILDDQEASGYWRREYAPGWQPRV
jgi:predicted dehydrogenase